MNKIIEVDNLIKNYQNVEAVKKISFTVDEGAFFAFLGINGAGKSTTINILCTVLEKTSGNVRIGGYSLDKQPDKIRDLIGIVFQTTVLDEYLTVKENLFSRASYYGLSRSQAARKINRLVEIFSLEEIFNRRYGKLSGGQKRRVDIARALINEPKILFLDEPTTGLDPQTRIQVWSIIHKLRKDTGLTVFLTTHYMEETSECDNVVIIDNGEIVANDSPNNLKNNYAHNRLVWYTQQDENIECQLSKKNLEFKYANSAYKIKIADSNMATKIINEMSVNDYEVIKGDMDDVFLNITGKRLGE